MTRYVFLLLVYIFFLPFIGEEQHISIAASPEYTADWTAYRSFSPFLMEDFEASVQESRNLIVIPLKRAGNLILLEAIIDGVSGNLILDSGSSSIVLNSMYFRQGRSVAHMTAGGMTGSTGTLTTVRINNMQMSELIFSRLEANTVDLGHIESARNTKVLGFFGLGLFNDYEIVIDLQNNSLELHRLNLRGNRVTKGRSPARYDMQLPAVIKSNVIFFDVNINKTRLIFCLDTGAESNVLTSTLPNHILSTVDISRRSILRGASGRDVEVLHGILNDLEIGRNNMGGMQVMVMNLNTMSHFYGLHIDGMLGCEFLEKGVFFINLKQEKVGIVFNK